MKKIRNRIIRMNETGSDNGGSTPPPNTEPPAHEDATPPTPPVHTDPAHTENNDLHAAFQNLQTKVQGMEAQLQELTATPPPQTDPKPSKPPWTHRGRRK